MNLDNNLNHGNLTLFIGPMFSGKTTKLLRTHNDLRFMKQINPNKNSKKDYLINYIKDTRYGRSTLIITHDGIQEECLAVEKLNQLWSISEFNKDFNFKVKNFDYLDLLKKEIERKIF